MHSDSASNLPSQHSAFAGSLFQHPTAIHTNPWSVGTSVAINGGILALLLCIGLGTTRPLPTSVPGTGIRISDFKLFAPSLGGGGGNHESTPASAGRLPQSSPTPIVPPQTRQLDDPLLPVNPAIAIPIQLPENTTLPNLGAHSSVSVILSDGPGANAGIGSGDNGGIGDRNGPGAGIGDHPGIGGIERPGVNGVTQPIPIVTPEAEFSDEARRAKYQGVCMVSVIVDAQGNPQNLRIVRRLGMGLDEKALQAVQGYRFKPARRNGRPVPVMITVAVNFRLF
jgi:TonB family protein